ncbi:hypothetical protein TNCV_3096901 [Trichonephila clavipes]|uniref:Uncharacterized protein n=1 Tax=Trichonephila clavipes TaxID=2585209 RepID=A0A8X6SH85_TRICX|nr:hypothetical protein TNCV_3096901 [Trichonephila clavipes]
MSSSANVHSLWSISGRIEDPEHYRGSSSLAALLQEESTVPKAITEQYSCVPFLLPRLKESVLLGGNSCVSLSNGVPFPPEEQDECFSIIFSDTSCLSSFVYNNWKSPNLVGCEADCTKERSAREKLHKLSMIDTERLPYKTIFAVDKPYVITANIDVADGLANGAVGKLSHVELYDQNRVFCGFGSYSQTALVLKHEEK